MNHTHSDVQAVLFDLDGTLIDSAPDLAAALNRLRGEEGLPPLPYPQLRPYASHGARGLIGAGFGVTPAQPEFPDLRDRFLALYEGALCVDTTIFEGVPTMLDDLRRRDIAWGIVTNKAKRFTEPLLRQIQGLPPPGCVISGDSTPRSKPHPDPLLAAATLLNIAPAHCVYVGDAERDVEAGRAAGMTTIAASYGYLGDSETTNHWQADAVIAAPAELIKALATLYALS